MTSNRLDRCLRFACAVPLLAWVSLASAQAPAPRMTPLAGSAASMTQAPPQMAPDIAAKPMKRRTVKRMEASACEAVNDPWENLCTIRRHAQVACSDLGTGAAKGRVSAKARKGRSAAPLAVGNPRQECVDAYMRNV